MKVTVPLPPKVPADSARRAICDAALKFSVPPLMTRLPASVATSLTFRTPPDSVSVVPVTLCRLRIAWLPEASVTCAPARSMNTRSLVPGSRSPVQLAASVHMPVPAPPSQQMPPQMAPA